MSLIVRPATIADLAEIFKYIHALAEYEKAPHEVVLSIDDLEQSFFCENPQVHCLLSEESGVVTGIAIVFRRFICRSKVSRSWSR
jgi:hypothetical protein